MVKITRIYDTDVLLARKPKKATMGKDSQELAKKARRQGKEWATGEETTLTS